MFVIGQDLSSLFQTAAPKYHFAFETGKAFCALPVGRDECRPASPGKFISTSLLWEAQLNTSAAPELGFNSWISKHATSPSSLVWLTAAWALLFAPQLLPFAWLACLAQRQLWQAAAHLYMCLHSGSTLVCMFAHTAGGFQGFCLRQKKCQVSWTCCLGLIY